MRLAAVLLASLASPALAAERAEPLRVARGTLREAQIPVEGLLQPHQEVPAYSPIEARVVEVRVSSGDWAAKDEVLAVLASLQLAAMLDADPTVDVDSLEKQWGALFAPARIRCPYDQCYVTQVSAKKGQVLRPGDPLLKVAPALKLETPLPGNVAVSTRPELAASLRLPDDPDAEFRAEVRAVAKGGRAASAMLLLPPRVPGAHPGRRLYGKLWIESGKTVLKVPSLALVRAHGYDFLAVEVRLGMDNGHEAELLSPVPEGTPLLVPDPGGGKPGLGRVAKDAFEMRVKLSGRVRPHEPTPVVAPEDGRVEAVMALPGQWVKQGEPVAAVASVELAALLDANPTTEAHTLEERWGGVFEPSILRCPHPDGYVFNVQVRSMQRVRTGDPLLTVAAGLKLDSPLPPEVAVHSRPGLTARLWEPERPRRKHESAVLAVREATADQPALATVLLPPRAEGVAPDTPVEGLLTFTSQEPVLKVPSSAVRREGGRDYVSLALEVGFDDGKEAELVTDVGEGRPYLLPPGAENETRRTELQR